MDQTHFISIPLNSIEMQEAHIKFKQDVLALNDTNNGERSKMTNSLRTIDETLFQSPSLLHLTIGTLSLMGKNIDIPVRKLDCWPAGMIKVCPPFVSCTTHLCFI